MTCCHCEYKTRRPSRGRGGHPRTGTGVTVIEGRGPRPVSTPAAQPSTWAANPAMPFTKMASPTRVAISSATSAAQSNQASHDE